MNMPVNKPKIRWMDAIALLFAVSIGAAALNGINHNRTSAPPPAPQPVQAQTVQVIAVASPDVMTQSLSAKTEPARKVLVITPMVKAALLRDDTLYPVTNPSLNWINVDTDSDGTTVVLKGKVQTESMKKRAETIAKKSLLGTSYKIDNQLTISKR